MTNAVKISDRLTEDFDLITGNGLFDMLFGVDAELEKDEFRPVDLKNNSISVLLMEYNFSTVKQVSSSKDNVLILSFAEAVDYLVTNFFNDPANKYIKVREIRYNEEGAITVSKMQGDFVVQDVRFKNKSSEQTTKTIYVQVTLVKEG